MYKKEQDKMKKIEEALKSQQEELEAVKLKRGEKLRQV